VLRFLTQEALRRNLRRLTHAFRRGFFLKDAVDQSEVSRLKAAQLATLKFFSLLFLLPGLAGLIISAMISTHYLEIMPRWPAPEEMRMTPRNINGTVVYQTREEDRRLSLAEYSSVGVFVIGLGLGLVYLEKWGASRARNEEDELSEDIG
jgi:hypothetical protein